MLYVGIEGVTHTDSEGTLLWSCRGSSIECRDLDKKGKRPAATTDRLSDVLSMACLVDGRQCMALTRKGSVLRLYKYITNGGPLKRVFAETVPGATHIYAMQKNPNALAYGTKGSALGIFDLETRALYEAELSSTLANGSITAICSRDSPKWIAGGTSKGGIIFWDSREKQACEVPTVTRSPVTGITALHYCIYTAHREEGLYALDTRNTSKQLPMFTPPAGEYLQHTSGFQETQQVLLTNTRVISFFDLPNNNGIYASTFVPDTIRVKCMNEVMTVTGPYLVPESSEADEEIEWEEDEEEV